MRKQIPRLGLFNASILRRGTNKPQELRGFSDGDKPVTVEDHTTRYDTSSVGDACTPGITPVHSSLAHCSTHRTRRTVRSRTSTVGIPTDTGTV